jgi:hypothetical protein
MPILRDIPISLTPDEVVEAQKGRRRRGARNLSAMTADAQRAIETAGPLYAPAVVYAQVAVQEVDAERVVLAPQNGQDHVLQVGPHVDLLAPATQLLAAVYTIGPALEERVAQLNQAGEVLAAYWLDTIGVMAVGAVGKALRGLAAEKALERDWGVGVSLSPGSLVGWPMRGQRALCTLLPLADIGVQLSVHCVLSPHKSASTVIGMGPGYEAHEVGSACRFCSLADSCWRRRV